MSMLERRARAMEGGMRARGTLSDASIYSSPTFTLTLSPPKVRAIIQKPASVPLSMCDELQEYDACRRHHLSPTVRKRQPS
jgi:hypothetical protein